MRPPIIVVDRDGWLEVYHSPDEVSRNLEPIDVLAGEYTAFDSEGRLLQLTVQERRRRVCLGLLTFSDATVQVLEAESEPSHRDNLREALQKYLDMVGTNRGLDEVKRLLASLSELGSESPDF